MGIVATVDGYTHAFWERFHRNWERVHERAEEFVKDARAYTITEWVVGVILLAVLGVGVAIPVIVDTVNRVLPNVSGITATILGIVPVMAVISLLLMMLGRR